MAGNYGAPATMNPWVQGGLQGADILGQILGEIFGKDDPMEKMMEWNLGQKKSLMPQLQRLPEGFGEGEVVKRQAASNKRFQPMFDKMAFNQAGIGGRGAPQTGRNMGIDIASILGQDENAIRDFLARLGTQRQQFKYGTMAGMV